MTNKIRIAKWAYNRKHIEENKHDQKAFWKTVKKILPGGKKNISSGIKINGKFSTDKYQIANAFNKYFIGVVTRFKESLGLVLLSVNNGILRSTSILSQKYFTQLKFKNFWIVYS